MMTTYNESSLQPDSQIVAKKEQITMLLQLLQSILTEALHDVNASMTYHDNGVTSSVIQKLEDVLSDPLGNMAHVHNSIIGNVLSLKASMISSLVISKQQNVRFAAFSHENKATHVFVGLVDDTLENREIFYEVVDKYEETILKDFPIIMHFVDDRALLSDVNNLNLIQIDEPSSESVHTQ